MKKIYLLLLFTAVFSAIFPNRIIANTYYVDAAKADNSGSGLSWGTAKKDVQAAINLAISGDNVWVKGGTYLPTLDPSGNASPTDPRDKTIYLKDGVKLYGSFAGTEITLGQRSASVMFANPTTLSGDIGVSGTNTDNCYHVVLSVSDGAATLIDGFVISGSYSTPVDAGTIIVETRAIARNVGGGLYNNGSTNNIASCIFNSNVAGLTGGGMYNNTSSPTIFNCTFVQNVSGNGGGMSNVTTPGLTPALGSPVITNSQFFGNRSLGGNGGAMYNGGLLTSTTITNSTFNSNITDNNGAGIYNIAGTHTIINCSFYNNQAVGAASTGGGIYFSTVGGTIKNSIFYSDATPSNAGMPTGKKYLKVPQLVL